MTNDEIKGLEEGAVLWDMVSGCEVVFSGYEEPVEVQTDAFPQSGDLLAVIYQPDHPGFPYQLAASVLTTEIPDPPANLEEE